MPADEVRALAFFSLVLTIFSLIFVNRSFSTSLFTALRRPNQTLALVLLAVVTMLSLTLLWPIASNLFRFGPLHLGRSCLDAWCRRSCARFPGDLETSVARAATILTGRRSHFRLRNHRRQIIPHNAPISTRADLIAAHRPLRERNSLVTE